MHSLEALFNWSKVAVVGASESTNYGSGPFRALKGLGFAGQYYPVNPRRTEVHGVRAYQAVKDLPEAIDVGVIVVGSEHVLEGVESCADQGARAVVVISAGFAELDQRGAELQRQLTAIARARGLLVVGPNCFGVASLVHRVAAGNASGLAEARVGNVGVVSHSGGLLNEVISYGTSRGIGFSHLASTGNEAGVTASHVVDYFVQDPNTQVILAILESVRDPDYFLSAARCAVDARKPLVALKLGASERSARSALTHTGALAGSDEVYSAVFRQHGIIRVDDIDELIEVGALLSGAVGVLRHRPLERSAVIEISGGGKGLVSDTAEAAGVDLPDPTVETVERLSPVMPRGIQVTNPLDTGLSWGVPDMGTLYPLALRAFAEQPDVDVVVSRYTPPRAGAVGALSARLADMESVREEHPERLFVVLSRTADRFSDDWARAITERRVVFLQGYGRGMRALARLANYSRYIRRHNSPRLPPHVRVVQRPAVHGTLNEIDSKDLLRAAGFPVIPTVLARTAEEAVTVATRIGYPLALKVVSPQIVHKSDAGGVKLHLHSDSDVRAAFTESRRVAEGLQFDGVAVQPMVAPGVELVIGAHRDPQFGPVIAFGPGGILVELLHDVALRVAPLTPIDADEMLQEIRARSLLDGARGLPPVDRGPLISILCQLAQFMLDRPWLESIDLNPVVAGPHGLCALDARVVISPQFVKRRL